MITVISSFFNESKNCDLFLSMIDECSDLMPISEIILVDNGSLDDTFLKLTKLKSQNFEIKILQNPYNSKYGDGFHRAFKESKNKFIFTIHSDLQFSLQDYIQKNIKIINECIKTNTNIFPKRINRSFFSSVRTIIFQSIISILNFHYFNDFNGQPKLLIKTDFDNFKFHSHGFSYDLSLYFYLIKMKKKINTSTYVLENKRIYGKTSWNKNLLSSLNTLLTVLNEFQNFKNKNFK
ncbi:glycosyltransferase family 2 protein [Alphaproteobacteria bacterium]|nr:glycosyltransferase family 2 protein [Alphaproteobacteria bacterium]